MATLSQTEIDNITQAAVLLETGNAPEIPYPSGVHDDIVFLVGKAANTSDFLTDGAFKDAMANAPISTLLEFIAFASASTNERIDFAIDWLLKSQAEEIPLDAQINYVISQGAANVDFDAQLTVQQRLQDKPISTLLRFLVFVGS